MGAEVIITSDAWRDLAGIIDYIAKDDPAAAGRFSDKLLDTALALGRLPHTGCKLKGFPGVRMTIHGHYLVIYKIESDRNRLLILRFWHSARGPSTAEIARVTEFPFPSANTAKDQLNADLLAFIKG